MASVEQILELMESGEGKSFTCDNLPNISLSDFLS